MTRDARRTVRAISGKLIGTSSYGLGMSRTRLHNGHELFFRRRRHERQRKCRQGVTTVRRSVVSEKQTGHSI